jgi:hypothetical protein
MRKTTTTKVKSNAKSRAQIKAEEAAALRAQKELAAFGAERDKRPGALSVDEIWWRQQYQWLKARGYLLRPRYAPDWVPSWEGSKQYALACEDGQVLHVRRHALDCMVNWLTAPQFGQVMDATRLSDGLYVSLKMVKKSEHPHELEIGQYFMSGQFASDPTNHCVPFLDVLSVPNESDTQIIVMPSLLPFTKPRFDTLGEVVECLRQLFEVRTTTLELAFHLSKLL